VRGVIMLPGLVLAVIMLLPGLVPAVIMLPRPHDRV
jgi:hypothetical protein